MRSEAPQSMVLESPLFSRFSVFKRQSRIIDILHKAGFGWWVGDQLRKQKSDFVKRLFSSSTSVAYLAPIDSAEAARMRHLAEILDCPFVLHLWDLLNYGLEDEHLLWLLRNASSVLCLSDAMIEYISPVRRDAKPLIFQRKPSRFIAKTPEDSKLVIALIGDLTVYTDGVKLLVEAKNILTKSDVQLEFFYVGPPSVVKRVAREIPALRTTNMAGFLKSDLERDRALSTCHVAFLPGPYLSPSIDRRSKFSIPSRLLDFWSIGLPLVGTVHKESATADFHRKFCKSDAAFCTTADEIASNLRRLLDKSEWQGSSLESQCAFDKVSKHWSTPILMQHLQDACRTTETK